MENYFEALKNKPYDVKIEEDELWKYNNAIKQKAFEALIDVSYFEAAERNIKKYNEIRTFIPNPILWIEQTYFDRIILDISCIFEGYIFEDSKNTCNINTYNINTLIEKALHYKDKTNNMTLQQKIDTYNSASEKWGNVDEVLGRFKDEIKKQEGKIKKIKTHRDKRLAHSEKNKPLKFFNEKCPLSVNGLLSLLYLALDVVDYVNFCLTDVGMARRDGFVSLDGRTWFDELFRVLYEGKKAYDIKSKIDIQRAEDK